MRGDRLQAARERAGLTRQGLAEMIGASSTAVESWERGRRNPKVEVLPELATLLSVTVDYLVGTDDPETMDALKAHKKHQAEVRLAAGSAYHNHGLVFAKEPSRNRTDTLGCPLQSNNIGQREYAKIIEAAGVKPIKFHGLRHTCATLLLQSGAKPYEVSERLGHRDVATTMEIYAHVLPSAETALVDLMRKGLGFIK